ncbi:MAG TPA: hypothetical protein VNR38_19600 [Ureibacillus sp.]|nr:hypothetical protein [Ureibacillus sp.]
MEHKLLFSIVIFLIITCMVTIIVKTNGVPKSNKILTWSLYSFCIIGLITMNFMND